MRYLDSWIHNAEQGSEFSLSVLVDGVVITGTLTPWARYVAWLNEVMMRGFHEGGRHAIPRSDIGPMSKVEAAHFRDAYLAEFAEKGADPEDPPVFPQFALRDA